MARENSLFFGGFNSYICILKHVNIHILIFWEKVSILGWFLN